MSQPVRLNAGPFREWCSQRLARPARAKDAIGEFAALLTAEELARDLGLTQRILHRWRFENKTLGLIDLEEALHRVGLGVWDLYTEAEIEACESPRRYRTGGRPAGVHGKLSDDQLRVLHRMHKERGATIRELGRQVWKQAGYASPESAGRAISRGFGRLELPARHSAASRVIAMRAGYRRCEETKLDGERCTSFAMRGADFCWPHDPANREAVARSTALATACRLGERAAA